MKISAGLFIVTSGHELLICHPTHHSNNVWTIPKGHVEKGEEYLQTAYRETEEETHLSKDILDKHMISIEYLGESVYFNKKKKVIGYLLIVDNGIKNYELKCDSLIGTTGFPENDRFEWLDINEAYQKIHYTQQKLLYTSTHSLF